MGAIKKEISFCKILNNLSEFWSKLDCVLIPPAQTEISSPLFHPCSFFGMIENKEFNFMYFQPHIASMDSKNVKYIMQNYSFLKFQVIIKSEIKMPQKIILDSLENIGFSIKDNDIKFENSNFENFIFRINASGYNLCFNNNTIARMYYIQNIGNCNYNNISLAISYDLDKIITILQNCKNIWEVSWNGIEENKNKILYEDIMLSLEKENCNFIDNNATNEVLFKSFESNKDIAVKLLENNIFIPAYISILKAKYYLDILNLRNYINYNNKINYNKILRNLLDICCKKYIENKGIGK